MMKEPKNGSELYEKVQARDTFRKNRYEIVSEYYGNKINK